MIRFVNVGDQALQIDAAFDVATAISGRNAARFAAASTLPGGDTTAPCAASLTLAANGGRCGLAITFSPDPAVLAGALQTASSACTGTPLAPGANCSVTATYAPPNTATPHVGELSIVSNSLCGPSATPGPHVVALEGVLGAAGGGLTAASINRTRVSFPATPVNQMSVAQTVVLSSGPAAAMQASFSGAGGTNSSFVINNGTCANLVAAGSSCAISIQFRPRSIGSKSETLTINCNGGSMSVALSGIGQSANIADGKGGSGVLPLAALPLLGLFVAGRVRPRGWRAGVSSTVGGKRSAFAARLVRLPSRTPVIRAARFARYV